MARTHCTASLNSSVWDSEGEHKIKKLLKPLKVPGFKGTRLCYTWILSGCIICFCEEQGRSISVRYIRQGHRLAVSCLTGHFFHTCISGLWLLHAGSGFLTAVAVSPVASKPIPHLCFSSLLTSYLCYTNFTLLENMLEGSMCIGASCRLKVRNKWNVTVFHTFFFTLVKTDLWNWKGSYLVTGSRRYQVLQVFVRTEHLFFEK